MSQPTREEVEAFITALNYGMKVQHKPEFLIALAKGWLENNTHKEITHQADTPYCDHAWSDTVRSPNTWSQACHKCGATVDRY